MSKIKEILSRKTTKMGIIVAYLFLFSFYLGYLIGKAIWC